MKKYVIYLMFAVAMLLVLPSCNRGTDVDFANNTLTLTLSCNNLGLTRATVDGEDAYNENLVEYIDCYFYPEGATFETQAKLVKSNVTVSAGETVGTYTATIPFEEAELTPLFGSVANGSSAKCLIYVIANRAGVSLPMNNGEVKLATINELKALTITSEFITSEGFKLQELFVMDSDGKPNTGNDTSADGDTNVDIANDDIVTLNVAQNGTKTLSGIVPLYRTAAKVTLNITRFGPENGNGVFVDTKGTETEDDDVTYVPNLNEIYAVFHNGVKQSHIAPDVVSNSNLFSGEDKTTHPYFNTGNFDMTPTAEGEVKSKLANPFYSYASDWSESGINEESYITLVVPWAIKDGETTKDKKEYFYKVPINYDGDKLERNTHYKINIAVSILGTLDPTETIEITPSYKILNWSNDEITTAMIDFRYLMVEQNSYVMNNINTIDIPYWTSHNCTIVNISVKKPDLKNGGDIDVTNEPGYNLDLTTKDGSNAYITYSRVLDNNYKNETFDFAPYTIKFRIQQTTQSTTYYEDITITQYPAIYGEYEENSDYTNGKDNNNRGYVYVNGYNDGINKNGVDDFGTVPGNSSITNGTNSRPGSQNRYIFTVTSVEGTPYVIGDPRDMDITFSAGDAVWRSARQIVNGTTISTQRELMYYYGTDVTSDLYTTYSRNQNGARIYNSDAAATAAERTINMVAPKFMLASGYALMNTNTTTVNRPWENLMKRCASYQEDGYPAGRWRLPTRAEFQLIMSQVDKGTLPQIYHENTPYWCAHGVGTPVEGSNSGEITMKYIGYDSSRGNSTRCVYDLWYWGEHDKMDPGTTTFTWGDVPRSDKAYAPSINY